jgi:hypothetical protein
LLDRETKILLLDTRDVPIDESYVPINMSHRSKKAKSKWLNAVHVLNSCHLINSLQSISCVERIDFANKLLTEVGSKRSHIKQISENKE